MRRRFVLSALVLALATTSFAQKQPKSKSNFPQVIVQATWVYVTSFRGDQFNPQVLPEDRQAVADIDEALRNWGRYKVVYRPENADITLVVRRGSLAALKGGAIGIGGTRGVTVGGLGGAEAGSPDDTLMVMLGDANALDGSVLWRRSQKRGLDAPDLTLFQEFKKQVEQAAAANKKP